MNKFATLLILIQLLGWKIDLPSPLSADSVSISQTQFDTTPNLTQEKNTTVYVTKTGAKYHLGSCRYLSKSKIPISLETAKKKYTACKVCKPPN